MKQQMLCWSWKKLYTTILLVKDDDKGSGGFNVFPMTAGQEITEIMPCAPIDGPKKIVENDLVDSLDLDAELQWEEER